MNNASPTFGAGLAYGFLANINTQLDYALLLGMVGEGTTIFFHGNLNFERSYAINSKNIGNNLYGDSNVAGRDRRIRPGFSESTGFCEGRGYHGRFFTG
jgi:hypothetical protein